MSNPVNFVSIRDLVGLTIKSVDKAVLIPIGIRLQAFISEASNSVMQPDRVKAILDELQQVPPLADTVRAVEHIVTNSQSVGAFCQAIRQFIDDAPAQAVRIESTGSKSGMGAAELAGGASGTYRKSTSEEESVAWDLINRS